MDDAIFILFRLLSPSLAFFSPFFSISRKAKSEVGEEKDYWSGFFFFFSFCFFLFGIRRERERIKIVGAEERKRRFFVFLESLEKILFLLEI